MHFSQKNPIEIQKEQLDFLERRKATQPYDKCSAGSIFKREANIIPAKIIDSLGLKGTKIGDAEISTKHAGFIVNNGNAKAIDVLALIDYIELKAGRKFDLEIIVIK